MKKFTIFLLSAVFLFSLPACNKKSADTDTSSTTDSSVIQNSKKGKAGPQPYYFSDNLKTAISNCTSYSEDIFEKNPDVRDATTSMVSMFLGGLDASQEKMLLTVQGKKGDKCQITVKYPMTPEYQCILSREEQNKLVNAMNDKSTEEKTRTFGTDGFSMTMTGREFDLMLSEITNTSCQLTDYAPSAEEQTEIVHKMMAFPKKFKNSLKNCTPDRYTFQMMGIDLNEMNIIGKEKGKCHIESHGFHIFLNDNELSLSGFDEFAKLLSNEKRVTYHPKYKVQGALSALNKCATKRMNQDNGMVYGPGTEQIALGSNIQIRQSVDSVYENGVCQVLFSLSVEKNGNPQDYSLRCDVADAKIAQYINPYSDLLRQQAADSQTQDGSFTVSFGKQTNKMTKADRELFSKMTKNKLCKKLSDFPAENSAGCSGSQPLKDWNNRCHSCNENQSINLSKSEDCARICNGSSGRSKRQIIRGDCVLESCPKNMPLKDSFGVCHSCDYDNPVEADEKCSLCPNRTIKNGECVVADCTNRPLLDENGICYPCTTDEMISMPKGKCTSICPNRVEAGSWSFGTKSGVFCTLKN